MKKSVFKNIFIYLLSLFCLLPLIIMIINSFKASNGFGFEQYIRALIQTPLFMQGFWNSILYTAVIIAINVPVSLLAAYGFTRFNFKGKVTLFWAYIVLMLMPFQATIVPQYITLKALGILDTAKAVILPNAFSTFGTFLIAQYMKSLDKELLEAGKIDGLNEFGLMVRLAVPICKPIFSALIVLLFINYWSMVEQPIIFISNSSLLPLSVTLNESYAFSSIIFACGVIFTVLPLLLYFLCYDDLVKGIAVYSSNINGLLSLKKDKKIFSRKRIGKMIAVFIVFMAICTVITQKVNHLMTAEVETISPYQGEINLQNDSDQKKSLGYFSMVLPKKCVVKEQDDSFIYVLTKDKSIPDKLQAIKTSVRILAENDRECAVDGGIYSNAEVVLFKSKQIKDGSYVKKINEKNSNMQGMVELIYTNQDTNTGFNKEDIEFLNTKYALDCETSDDGEIVKRITVSSIEKNSSIFFKEQLINDISEKINIDDYTVKDYTANERVFKEFKNIYLFLLQLIGFFVICYLMYNILKSIIKYIQNQYREKYFSEIIDINSTELLICSIKLVILFFIGIFLLREILDYKFFILGEYIPSDYILDFKFYHNAFMVKRDLAVNYFSEYESIYMQKFNKCMIIFTIGTIISLVISVFAAKKLKLLLCKVNDADIELNSRAGQRNEKR